MTIDKNNRVVTVNGTMLELTGKEFDLLFFLATNKGRVFTKNVNAKMDLSHFG